MQIHGTDVAYRPVLQEPDPPSAERCRIPAPGVGAETRGYDCARPQRSWRNAPSFATEYASVLGVFRSSMNSRARQRITSAGIPHLGAAGAIGHDEPYPSIQLVIASAACDRGHALAATIAWERETPGPVVPQAFDYPAEGQPVARPAGAAAHPTCAA